MEIGISELKLPKSGAVAGLLGKEAKLTGLLNDLDKETGGAIARALKSSRFEGRPGEIVEVVAPANIALTRILVVGLGKTDELKRRHFETVGGALAARLLCSGETELTILLDQVRKCPVAGEEMADAVASGFRLRSYRFDKYRTKEPEYKKPSLKTVRVATKAADKAKELWDRSEKVLEGVFLTRDLVSEPANVLYPASFAAEIEKLEELGVEVKLLREKELERIGMNALLGVGQGSNHESYVAVMRWNGSPKGEKDAPVAFVGKGVTFDTGGISIKPAQGMEEMKWDMGGAGIVTGTMMALAKRKAKVNVVGVVGLVENMPSGAAQRPGDIVTSLSGQTIEILNTDAEGRLVLADVLWYAQDRFKPRVMIDLATLTGAMIVSLGRGQYAGYFTDDDKLAKALEEAGEDSGDLVWRFPLTEEYDRMIDTPSADVKNIGNRDAGSITAAQFLKRFTNDVPWAHIDVAGMVWSLKDGKIWEKGATGYGVRLLDRLIANNYEAP